MPRAVATSPQGAFAKRPSARGTAHQPPHSGYAVNGLMMVSPDALTKSLTLRVANS